MHYIIAYIQWLTWRKRKKTYVKIPRGLLSTITIAELVLDSSIFFAVAKTVSLGSTTTTLEKPEVQ